MTIRFQFPVERTLHIRPTWRAFWIFALCSLACTGCASVMNGRTQVMAVSSDPPGAHVLVDEEHVGVTPTFVDLPRRERNLTLRLEKEGFGSVHVPVRRSASGWLWGDAALAVTNGLVAGQAIGHRKTQCTHVFLQSAGDGRSGQRDQASPGSDHIRPPMVTGVSTRVVKHRQGGYNYGFDFTFRITERFGIGILVRTAMSFVPSVSGHTKVPVAGGSHVGIGARLHF